jgi:hypothetical protein
MINAEDGGQGVEPRVEERIEIAAGREPLAERFQFQQWVGFRAAFSRSL